MTLAAVMTAAIVMPAVTKEAAGVTTAEHQ
jgi:hypothetical protein